MIGFDEGVILVSATGEVLCFTLEASVGADLGCFDGSFGGSFLGSFDVSNYCKPVVILIGGSVG